ncbi:MAG: glycerate kinase type-2 family protein [Alphaproteobacteria bacterium]
MTMTKSEARALLKHLFMAGIEAAHPAQCLGPHLPPSPKGRVIVLGAGKAAGAMAAAFEQHWQGPAPEGMVITRYGHNADTKHIEIREAAHPVPDEAGVAATEEALRLAECAGADDLVIVLLSGGASALLVAPQQGVTLSDKQNMIREMLASGADIAAINKARTALSRVKGGKLAHAAHPAPIHTFAISDVVGDDPAIIGSGPSHAKGAPYTIIANGKAALNAIEAAADMNVIRLGDELTGDAQRVALEHAAQIKAMRLSEPTLLISGGELTLTLPRPHGFGGPSRHYALCLHHALQDSCTYHALIADSDGSDGEDPEGTPAVAGAFIHSGKAEGAARAIETADSASYFASRNDSLITGPTGTNVNDLRLILLLPR